MMAEGLNVILGKPPVKLTDIKLPEISTTTTESTINTDFSQEAIADALNKFNSLSVTEKETFWKEVAKEFKKD